MNPAADSILRARNDGSSPVQKHPCLILNPLEAWLPGAVGELAVELARFVDLARLLEILGALPKNLSVGRLGLVGIGEGTVGELELTIASQRLGQVVPG